MTTEERVARTESQIITIEKNVSEIWSQFNAHKTYSETQFRYIIDTVSNHYKQHIEKSEQRIKDYVDLKMEISANEVADAVSSKIKGSAWDTWRIVESVFKIGVIVGITWIGIQQAKAESIPDNQISNIIFIETELSTEDKK